VGQFVSAGGQILKKICISIVILVLLVAGIRFCNHNKDENSVLTIVNVSYDPTREFYEQYNELFKSYYKEKYGEDIKIIQSHGGSSAQVRSVIEGLDADVVTLALEHDVSLLENVNLLSDGWKDRLPGDSSPYTSAIVFLVRKGNTKNIQDWGDLVKDGVEIITPDPKSSGGACWNFLAAWYYADKLYDGNEDKIESYMTQLYENVIVLDSGARSATTTFVENGQGDVLVAWENEAIAVIKEYPDEYELISPSVSILAQPSVAVVDEIAEKNGTTEACNEYLSYLYSDEAQRLAGECGFRPYNEEILEEFADSFDLDMELCTIDYFGGWDAVYEKFFVDGGLFDEIYGN
jgi:sulfate transport system substrate-binding protein